MGRRVARISADNSAVNEIMFSRDGHLLPYFAVGGHQSAGVERGFIVAEDHDQRPFQGVQIGYDIVYLILLTAESSADIRAMRRDIWIVSTNARWTVLWTGFLPGR